MRRPLEEEESRLTMKDKLKKLWIWIRKEVLNKGMLVWLIIAEAIFWSPCIAGAILGAVVNSWYYTICGVYAAFWAGPFTPAIPLQIGLAYGLKKMAEGIRKLRHRKKGEEDDNERL